MPETLTQLGIRIDGGNDVKASEVKDAYAAEIEAIQKEGQSPEAQRYIDELLRTRDRLLKQLEELRDANKKDVKHEATQLRLRLAGELKQSAALRERFNAAKEEVQKRLKFVEEAIHKSEQLTNPEASDARIPDYDAWGWAWESGYSDENFNNPTRWALSGWLAAFSMRGDTFAQQEFAKAVDIYEKSDAGWLTVDAALQYEEMVKGMNMTPHMNAIPSDLQLLPEAHGFAGGYLAVGAAQLKEKQVEEYTNYFLASLKDPQFKEQLNYTRPDGISDEKAAHEKARHQMFMIGKLMTPTEWLEKQNAVKKSFLDLRADADTVSKNLGIELKDPELKALLLREEGSFAPSDLATFDAARETIRQEASEHLKGVRGQLLEEHGKVSTAADLLFEKNKETKSVSQEDMDAVKARLKYANAQIDKILISESDPLSNVTKVGKEVNTVRGYIASLSTRISVMDEKLDAEEKRREEEAERKEKEEERRKKSAAAAGGAAGVGAGAGAVADTPDSKKESKETKEGLTAFLSDKNLEEKKVDDGSEYLLGRPDVVKKNGTIQLEFKNSEVQESFGKQLNAYLLAAHAVLTPEKRTSLSHFVDKGGYTLKSLFSFLGTMAEVANILDEALKDSTLKFPGRPSLSRIEGEYKKTFVPAWEKAGKRLNDLVGDSPKKNPEKNVAQPEKAMEIPAELQFLGDVDPRYIPVMHQIASYGNRPEGLTVQLPFSPGFTVPVSFRRAEGAYVLDYPGGRVRYSRIEHVLREINTGVLHQRYIDSVLRLEKPYQQYEKSIGKLDKNREGRTPGEIQLELDWTNPDPDIFVRALPHGHIVYTVNRRNIGPNGEEFRSLYADNFNDFMIQLGHLRKWAEGPKHKDREVVESERELLFDSISNPYFFRNPNIASRIGRVVSFGMGNNELVRMYLDWGGGENALSPHNAMLNVWVTPQGELMYTLNGPGIRVIREKTPNLDAMTLDIERRRKG